ncbi:MAG: histidinol-phosphate aminotransferase family protein [Myxococcales bacterium]|nr:histidinol-phosphate aminotransferase family protein [Myxococcales bacterium]
MTPESQSLRPRACFVGATGYAAAPKRGPITLDLAGNEGVGPSPEWLAETWRVTREVSRYPDVSPLRVAIAELRGVSPDRVVVTPGADDALDRVCRLVLEPGTSAVVPTPTFEMIERYVALAGAELVAVPWDDGALTADRVLAAVRPDTRLVALVTPNNPTGAAIDAGALVDVARALPGTLVLVDLAYVEFADEDPTPALLHEPNIVVVRTLSKAWGLAGLRVGYALAAPHVAAWLGAAAGPYGVSAPSIALAAAWLRDGRDAVDRGVVATRVRRAALSKALATLGWNHAASQANFVTVDDPRSVALGDALAEAGVRVRTWPTDPVRRRYARITSPTDDAQLAALLDALGAATALVLSQEFNV